MVGEDARKRRIREVAQELVIVHADDGDLPGNLDPGFAAGGVEGFGALGAAGVAGFGAGVAGLGAAAAGGFGPGAGRGALGRAGAVGVPLDGGAVGSGAPGVATGMSGCSAGAGAAPFAEGAGFLGAGSSLFAAKASRTRRTTGASSVEDGPRTYSPFSPSQANSSLLVFPISLAISWTRGFATTLLQRPDLQGADLVVLGHRWVLIEWS